MDVQLEGLGPRPRAVNSSLSHREQSAGKVSDSRVLALAVIFMISLKRSLELRLRPQSHHIEVHFPLASLTLVGTWSWPWASWT